MAEDCLGVALAACVKARQDIPRPSPLAPAQVLVPVSPIIAAKLALYSAMRQQGITNVALDQARLGLSEGAVRRLVNPSHRSHISQVEKALQVVGRGLVVEDRAGSTPGSTIDCARTSWHLEKRRHRIMQGRRSLFQALPRRRIVGQQLKK